MPGLFLGVLALPTLPSVREERPPQIDGRHQTRRLSIDGVQGAGCQAPVEGDDQDLPLPAGRDAHQLGMAAPSSGDLETHAVKDTQHVAGREASQTRHQSVQPAVPGFAHDRDRVLPLSVFRR